MYTHKKKHKKKNSKHKPTTCVTQSNTQKRALAAHRKTYHLTHLHISPTYIPEQFMYFSHKHTRSHKHPTKTSRVDSQKISLFLSLYLQHPARAHVWQSGNTSGPLKPKPIRSLMQTCRAPLSFISLFNVRGLESDSITYPKERKRENYQGFQITHMFLSRLN